MLVCRVVGLLVDWWFVGMLGLMSIHEAGVIDHPILNPWLEAPPTLVVRKYSAEMTVAGTSAMPASRMSFTALTLALVAMM